MKYALAVIGLAAGLAIGFFLPHSWVFVEDPMAEKILRGELKEKGIVKVVLKNKELDFIATGKPMIPPPEPVGATAGKEEGGDASKTPKAK